MQGAMWIKAGGEGTVAPVCSFGQLSWAADTVLNPLDFAPVVAGLEEATLRPTQAPIPLVPVPDPLDPYAVPVAWTWTQPLFHPFCALHEKRTVADAKAVNHHPLPAKKTAAGTRLRLLVGGRKLTYDNPFPTITFVVVSAVDGAGGVTVTTRVTVPSDCIVKNAAAMPSATSEPFACTQFAVGAVLADAPDRNVYGMILDGGDAARRRIKMEGGLELFYSGAHLDGAGGYSVDAGSETRVFFMTP